MGSSRSSHYLRRHYSTNASLVTTALTRESTGLLQPLLVSISRRQSSISPATPQTLLFPARERQPVRQRPAASCVLTAPRTVVVNHTLPTPSRLSTASTGP